MYILVLSPMSEIWKIDIKIIQFKCTQISIYIEIDFFFIHTCIDKCMKELASWFLVGVIFLTRGSYFKLVKNDWVRSSVHLYLHNIHLLSDFAQDISLDLIPVYSKKKCRLLFKPSYRINLVIKGNNSISRKTKFLVIQLFDIHFIYMYRRGLHVLYIYPKLFDSTIKEMNRNACVQILITETLWPR